MTNLRDRPHLLIVTPYYWPEIAASVPLMHALAEGLATRQLRVTVLTTSSGSGGSINSPDGREPEGAVRVVRTWNPFARRSGRLNKLFEAVWFFVGVGIRGCTVGSVDLIFVSSSPPLAGLPVVLLGKLLGAPVIYNLQDLFPESAAAAGVMRRKGMAYRLFQALERWMYKVVTVIVPISDAFAEHVRRLAPRTPMVVIPNWADTEKVREVPNESNSFLREAVPVRSFVVQYAGSLGYLQHVGLLVDAAVALRSRNDIVFLFVGDGAQRVPLQRRVAEEGLANCVFIDFQPYERLSEVYSACDVGVVPLRPGAGVSSIPSKTWNYLACSRPVIACVERPSPLAAAIDHSGAGWVVSPDGGGELAALISRLAGSLEPLRVRGDNGRRYVVERLSRAQAIDKYYGVVSSLVRRRE